MIYVNLIGFGLLSIATIYFIYRVIKIERRKVLKDPEFYGLMIYCIAALSYFQAGVFTLSGVRVTIQVQRSLNFIICLAIWYSAVLVASRKGLFDAIIKRFV